MVVVCQQKHSGKSHLLAMLMAVGWKTKPELIVLLYSPQMITGTCQDESLQLKKGSQSGGMDLSRDSRGRGRSSVWLCHPSLPRWKVGKMPPSPDLVQFSSPQHAAIHPFFVTQGPKSNLESDSS